MPEYENNETGVAGADTTDNLQSILNEHREGKHSGRRKHGFCPHCQESASDIRERAAWLAGSIPPWQMGGMAREWGSSVPPRDPDAPPWPGPRPGAASEARDMSQLEEDIRMAWRRLSGEEEERTIAKGMEYGARDLEVFGAVLRILFHIPAGVTNQEVGSTVYSLGKMSRIVGALADGRPGSEDSWHDLGIYARMVQLIRERGGWMQ